MTDVSTHAPPFVGPPPSLNSADHQKLFQNTLQAPHHDNSHQTHSTFTISRSPFLTQDGGPFGLNILDHTSTNTSTNTMLPKQGNDSNKAPWPSPQITTLNSRARPAPTIRTLAGNRNINPSTPHSPCDVALSYSTATQKSHGNLAAFVECADCFQKSPLHPLSATTSPVAPPLLQSNAGLHQPSPPLMQTFHPFTPPNPSTAIPCSWYPAFPPTMQFPSYPAMITQVLSHNSLLPTNGLSSIDSINQSPSRLATDQGVPPQPYAPPSPSPNPPENSQIQMSKARRDRRASALASDRRATSIRLCPYRRPQKKQPAVEFEPDVKKLQDRCKKAGAEEQAVLLIEKVFVNGVNLPSLTRKLSAKELATHQFGGESGQVYVGFLHAERDTRYTCRLCPTNTEMSWKHRRDVLRHLRRDHFGLAEKCQHWCVSSQLLADFILCIHLSLVVRSLIQQVK